MKSIWFISDLHLSPSRPDIISQFLDFLANLNDDAESLFILGDLFEYWIGDDVVESPQGEFLQPIISALGELSGRDIKLYFIHGNRDFLIAEKFAEYCSCELLPEQYMLDLFGEPTLIMHGDSLCTDDVAYQRFRSMMRSPDLQQQMLALPIPIRLQKAEELRLQSKMATDSQSEEILDVNQLAVENAMRAAGVRRLIHGHTHRPAVHRFEQDGIEHTRLVLGDWYTQSSYLRVSQAGAEFTSMGQTIVAW